MFAGSRARDSLQNLILRPSDALQNLILRPILARGAASLPARRPPPRSRKRRFSRSSRRSRVRGWLIIFPPVCVRVRPFFVFQRMRAELRRQRGRKGNDANREVPIVVFYCCHAAYSSLSSLNRSTYSRHQERDDQQEGPRRCRRQEEGRQEGKEGGQEGWQEVKKKERVD